MTGNVFSNRIVGYTTKRAADLVANPLNFRTHPGRQREAVQASLRELGWIAAVVENVTTGKLIDGHLRVAEAARRGEEVPVLQVALTEAEERLALATFDPITYMAEVDAETLSTLLHEVNTGEAALQKLLAGLAEEHGVVTTDVEPESTEGDMLPLPAAEVQRRDVPDAVWPSDNDLGVPLLDIKLQATAFDQPAALWGAAQSRRARMNGTWLFYTEDYRYEALWADPSAVLNSGAVAAVEPNFSAYSNMPPAVALWQIYRKRWIARWWQSYGLRIWADLNVATVHAGLNRLGIPSGWKAFATRGYSARIDATHEEYAIACEIAGDATPLFLVYGGGQAVKDEARRNGWLWVPEDMDRAKRNPIAEVNNG